jgi:hypothetical protein
MYRVTSSLDLITGVKLSGEVYKVVIAWGNYGELK